MAENSINAVAENESAIIKGLEAALGGDEGEEATAEPEEAPKKKAKAEPETAETSEPEEEEGAQAAAEDEETEEAPEEEKTETEDETVEVPDTLAGLASQLQVDPNELAQHLRVQVKVDGRTAEVPLAEAVASYQREQHWQQKNQQLAEERRIFEEREQTLNTERQNSIQVLGALAQHAQQLIVGEAQQLKPELEEEDPVEYARQERRIRQKWEQWQQLLNGIGYVQAQQQQQAQQNEEMFRASQARALAERVPEWGSDTFKAQREIAELRTWAMQQYGYSQAEVDKLYDHRTILAFRELKALKEQKAGVPLVKKKLQKATPTKVTKPGVSEASTNPTRSSATAALKKLRKTGDYRDGADALIKLGMVN